MKSGWVRGLGSLPAVLETVGDQQKLSEKHGFMWARRDQGPMSAARRRHRWKPVDQGGGQKSLQPEPWLLGGGKAGGEVEGEASCPAGT